MKKTLFIIIVLAFTLKACGQQEFNAPVTFNKGFRFSLTGPIYTSIPNSGVLDWNVILNKPVFSTVATTGDYNDLKNLPQQISLSQAIENMGYLPIPEKTTTEISGMSLPVGKSGIVKDKTLGVYKLWDGTGWSKIVITSN